MNQGEPRPFVRLGSHLLHHFGHPILIEKDTPRWACKRTARFPLKGDAICLEQSGFC